jgi:hypothetical protein
MVFFSEVVKKRKETSNSPQQRYQTKKCHDQNLLFSVGNHLLLNEKIWSS